MQVFPRPKKPDKFDGNVEKEREALEELFRSLEHAASSLDQGEATRYPKPDFPPKWGEFKAEFARAQHGKCGYCEIPVIGGQPGDVEHFFPKGEVWDLHDDARTWGAERTGLSNVTGLKHKVISDRGYWWLAYDWNNYLLACQVCNQYWKLSFFPVADNPRRLPPAKGKKEDPLLLNPFVKKHDPCKHLLFDDLGQISARNKSPRGSATIRTCGLDRESLRRWRMEKASRAHFLVKELDLASTVDNREKIRGVLGDFQSLGDERFPHSGMVRAIFYQGTGMKWSALEKILES